MGVSVGRDELTGFNVGLTAERRAAELHRLLERHGAIVIRAPAIRIVHLSEDAQLHRATLELIDDPPDVVVVTTGFGFRGWIDAAHAWGLSDGLLAALRHTRIVARGPKALGAVRQAGLREQWSAPSESSTEVIDELRGEAPGLRIAVQLHGAGSELEPNADVCRPLSAAGADVVRVPVYRWQPPSDPTRMDGLINLILDGRLDALTFTSALAAASVIGRVRDRNVLAEFVAALNDHTVVACVGPVTSTSLNRTGIATIMPTRYRLGALARLILEELPRGAAMVNAGGHQLQLRKSGVVVDGEWRPLSPASLGLLSRLVSAGGNTVAPRDLTAAAGQRPGTDAYSAIMRLREALGVPGCIETIENRGYRLAVEPA